jgi:hypothetical protein
MFAPVMVSVGHAECGLYPMKQGFPSQTAANSAARPEEDFLIILIS